jgi:hypothetical protein
MAMGSIEFIIHEVVTITPLMFWFSSERFLMTSSGFWHGPLSGLERQFRA